VPREGESTCGRLAFARYEIYTQIGGEPANAILKAVEELGVDSVVMPTHGRKGIGRLILGSVAERVVRESPRPVLTVRAAAAGDGRGPR